MRVTVDEKLQSTLEKRLGESFKMVNDRLEQVYKGLGEMQNLATWCWRFKKGTFKCKNKRSTRRNTTRTYIRTIFSTRTI